MNRVYRSETDKMLGGVCGGLGEYLKIDPLLLRILFVVLTIANGVGIAAYLVLWVILPTRSKAGLSQDQLFHENVNEIGQRARGFRDEARDALSGPWGSSAAAGESSSKRMLVIGAVLVVVGLLILLDNLGLLFWFRIRDLWPLILIALGSLVLLNSLKGKQT